MKGNGRTVFQGTAIEEFQVEILGVGEGCHRPNERAYRVLAFLRKRNSNVGFCYERCGCFLTK